MMFECVRELMTEWDADPSIPLQLNRSSSFRLSNQSLDEDVPFTIWDMALRESGRGDSNSLAMVTSCRSHLESANSAFTQDVATLTTSGGDEEKHPFLRRAIRRALSMRAVVGAIHAAVASNVSLVGEELYKALVRKAVETWGGRPEEVYLEACLPAAFQSELMEFAGASDGNRQTQMCKMCIADGIGVCSWLAAVVRLFDLIVCRLTSSQDTEEPTTNTGRALHRIRLATALNPDSQVRTLLELRVLTHKATAKVATSTQEIITSVLKSAPHPVVVSLLWGRGQLSTNFFPYNNQSASIANEHRHVAKGGTLCIMLQHSQTGALIVFPYLAAWDSPRTEVGWGQLVMHASRIWRVRRPYFKSGSTCVANPTDYSLWKKGEGTSNVLVVFEHFNSEGSEDHGAPLVGPLLFQSALYGPYLSTFHETEAEQTSSSVPATTLTTQAIEQTRKAKELDFFLSTKLNFPNGTKMYAQKQTEGSSASSTDLAVKYRAKLDAMLRSEKVEKEHVNVHSGEPPRDGNSTSKKDVPDATSAGLNGDDHLSKIYARVAPEANKAGIDILRSPFKGPLHPIGCSPTEPTHSSGGGVDTDEDDIAAECERILKDLYSRKPHSTRTADGTQASAGLSTEAEKHLRKLVRMS